MAPWIGLLALLVAIPSTAMAWAGWQAFRLPRDHPRAYLARRTRPDRTLLCLGDSITHGRIGADWVKSVREACAPRGLGVVNAGLNGDLAWNVRQRLDHALQVQPDAAVLLIGTNDAMGAHLESRGRDYVKNQKLPTLPTLKQYTEQLRLVLLALTSSVDHVAVCTLPPLGEQPSADPSSEHDAVVRRLADEFDVRLLDLRATLAPLCLDDGAPYRGEIAIVGRLMVRALASHYLVGRGWDDVARRSGQGALIDTVHLSDRAGAEVARLVQAFVDEVIPA
ncbi:MAG: hypothetical protein GY898_16610 [Proteobacteria bacterium]|nr:hypothetical protein [Pseudomonadota bacterium]